MVQGPIDTIHGRIVANHRGCLMKKPAFAIVIGLVAYGINPVLGQENKGSAFINAVKPESVIRRFYDIPKTCTWERSGPSVHSVNHVLRFQANCAIKATREAELIGAMREEIEQRLKETRTRSVERHDESGGGLHLAYLSGKNVGTVSMSTLEHIVIQHDEPLPTGYEDVRLVVSVEEKLSE
jgi:hypothetical protein